MAQHIDLTKLKANHQLVVQQKWWDAFYCKDRWTYASVENEIKQAFLFAQRAVKESSWEYLLGKDMVSRSAIPVVELDNLIKDIWISPCLGSLGNTVPLGIILSEWFGVLKDQKTIKILILHSLEMTMKDIGAIVGFSRLTTSRRHSAALERIAWFLNHPESMRALLKVSELKSFDS